MSRIKLHLDRPSYEPMSLVTGSMYVHFVTAQTVKWVKAELIGMSTVGTRGAQSHQHQLVYDAQTLLPRAGPVSLDELRGYSAEFLNDSYFSENFQFFLPPIAFCQDRYNDYRLSTNWMLSRHEKFFGPPSELSRETTETYSELPTDELPPTFSVEWEERGGEQVFAAIEYFILITIVIGDGRKKEVKFPVKVVSSAPQKALEETKTVSKLTNIVFAVAEEKRLMKPLKWVKSLNTKESDKEEVIQTTPNVDFRLAVFHPQTLYSRGQKLNLRVLILTDTPPTEFHTESGERPGVFYLKQTSAVLRQLTKLTLPDGRKVEGKHSTDLIVKSTPIQLDLADAVETRTLDWDVWIKYGVKYAIDITACLGELVIPDCGPSIAFHSLDHHNSVAVELTFAKFKDHEVENETVEVLAADIVRFGQ